MLGKRSLFCLVLVLLVQCFSVSYAQENTVLKGKKVLFVYGGWPGHDPKGCKDLFVPWLQSEGADVVTKDNLDCYTDEQLMSSVDLIIQVWTMDKITGEQEKGLLKAVRNGAGLAGWHGGLGDSFRDNTEYQFMVGGQWVAHPGGGIEYDVHIINHKDPIVKGIKTFHVSSEQYYMHVDPNVKVLATTKCTGDHVDWIDGAVMPVVWKKTYGKGRVFYNSLGHNAKVFSIPEAFEIMKRGIRWASLSKYEPKEEWMSPVYKY